MREPEITQEVDVAESQLREIQRALDRRKLAFYKPYPKQIEFHNASGLIGKDFVSERLLMAANQVGKTYCAGNEVAFHATGDYPAWFKGRRFNEPTKGWVGSDTGQTSRDVPQKILLGDLGEWGTGTIPGNRIVDIKKAPHGVAEQVEKILVRHKTGGVSQIGLKTYDQGRIRWQGDTLHYCIAEGQRVWMADGRYIPIESVVPGDRVISVTGRGVRVARTVVAVHDRGEKDIVEARMSRGPWLKLTNDHEVYTTTTKKCRVDKAQRVYQLPGGFEPLEPRYEERIDAYYMWAGLVLSEGSVACQKITMSENEAIHTAIAALPPEARVRKKVFAEKHHHVPDWFLYWKEFWDLIPIGTSGNKAIPDWIFLSSNRQIAVFLSYLFSGDGWAAGHGIGYASCSRTLTEQVSALLWRLGVRSTVVRRPSTEKWAEQWHIHVCSAHAVLRFVDTIGIVGKEEALAKVVAEATRRSTSRSGEKSHLHRATRNEQMAEEYKRRNALNKERYAKIREITPSGRSRVYDLSVEEEHRFVVGNSVVSNCWLDEEPDMDVYMEAKTRTHVKKGLVFLTFTPLKGQSEVVLRFTKEKPPGTHVTRMTIYDAKHYTKEQADAYLAGFPEHQRQARGFGVPMLGEGAVFPFSESLIKEGIIQIPAFWPRIAGLDVGFDHPTAVAWLAWDRDVDVVHVYDTYRLEKETALTHSNAIKVRGAWIPVAWPHDAHQHDKGSGKVIAEQYRKEGVNMLRTHATHPPGKGQKEGDGGTSFEAGIEDMKNRIQTGRLKVASHLEDWFDEYRGYHREKGLVVKKFDDLMSATRIAMMCLRFARTYVPPQQRPSVAKFTPSDPSCGVLG